MSHCLQYVYSNVVNVTVPNMVFLNVAVLMHGVLNGIEFIVAVLRHGVLFTVSQY